MAVLILSTLSSQETSAQLASRRETLRGHEQIFLNVNISDTEATNQTFGLRKESLEKFLLRRLDEAGIKATNQYTAQTLILEINVDLHQVAQTNEEQVYAFVSQFDAIQAAKLATNHEAALATTWKSLQFGAVSKAQSQLLRDSVVQNLDRFIEDWQAVNRPTDR